MKNLVLAGEQRRCLELSKSVDVVVQDCHVVGICDGDEAYFVLTNDGMLAKLVEKNTKNSQMVWVSQLNGLCENPCSDWFKLALVDADEVTLVGLSRSGAIVIVNPSSGQAELVGEFEHGLQAASFSPDGELLCLLTFSENEEDDNKLSSALLLMNTQWEVLAETTVDTHISTSQAEVSMCWRPDGSLLAISSVDAADNTRKIRSFKRDNLQFHAIGRTEDGSGKLVPNVLPTTIAWAGAGCSQLLAAAQRKGKKVQQIIFFEPNGNRHREFGVREDQSTEILGLAWNVESDLLAVSLRTTDCDKVQCWYRSNYHWYLKAEIRLSSIERLSQIRFHDERPNLLFVFLKHKPEWREYKFVWHSSNIQLLAPKACVAHVVDGNLLNLTALDQAMMPPPMYASTIPMDQPISHIILSHDSTKPISAVVILSDSSFCLLGSPIQYHGKPYRFSTPDFVARGSLQGLQGGGIDFTTLRSFVLVEQTQGFIRLMAVACAPANRLSESLVILQVEWNQKEQSASISVSSPCLSIPQRVLCASPWLDYNKGAIIGLEDGKLLELDFDENGTAILRSLDAHEFMEPCAWIAGIKDITALSSSDNHDYGESNILIFGLSLRSRLFCHDLLLADAVSSFFVSVAHQFLCYTAAQGSMSQLRFLPLRELQNFDTLMGSDSNIVLEGYEPRSVERGSRLVAILPGRPSAVLQMPRGNLEGIYPRALVLQYVMEKIATGDYVGAFSMMRRQKVNMNLLVDLNPTRFLERDLTEFVKQMTTIDSLNLFISCLQNWDSTQTQYRLPPWVVLVSEMDQAANRLFDFTSKVNQVCVKMRAVMLTAEKNGCLEGGQVVEEGHYLLPVLTTFAKENPPKLEQALTLIKENALNNGKEANNKSLALFSDTVQCSIQYLAFLADHELIFNVGLGLYDFDIARACARNSQMDPKVYLPLLKRLRSLPTYFARYEVDMRLKRYEKALRNLFKSGQEEESLECIIEANTPRDNIDSAVGNGFDSCMALIERYGLHKAGLGLFNDKGEKKRQIMLSLGEKLLKENKANIALSVFLNMHPIDIEKAKKAARACRDWKSFFALSHQSEEDTESDVRMNAAKEISEAIALTSENQYKCQNNFGDASRILLDYCNDVDSAVDMLVKGWLWKEGCRIASLYSREDLCQKCSRAALEFAETAKKDLEDRKATFLVTSKRYAEVLEFRKDAVRSGEAEDIEIRDETGSLFSVASNASNLSLQSTASTDSLSSVISIKSISSFTISGAEATTRHKSKFNTPGGKKQKKKKKKQGKRRIRPGSAEELKSLVDTLRLTCVDKDFGRVISDTIDFLCQSHQSFKSAGELYSAYIDLATSIEACRLAREDARKAARLKEIHIIPITFPVEEEVDNLSCAELPGTLTEIFSLGLI